MTSKPPAAKSATRSSKKPAVSKAQSRPQSTSLLASTTTVLIAFSVANSVSALYSPIPDCDEVFNYWEPAHYLSHRYGLQTWEYSPEYAIRSWFYVALHAVVAYPAYIITGSKIASFYSLRIILGLVCAYSQTRLYEAISRGINPRIAAIFAIALLGSPGMWHAAPAFLPSSFSMYAGMLGAAEFIDWRAGRGTAAGIMYFGIGGLLGWPFATALVVPFLFLEVVMAAITDERVEMVRKLVDGSVRCTIFLSFQVAVDAFFYHKAVIVPWNIVKYNVFGGEGKGPDIFGTEPWDFYFRNLLLNFNVWTGLALLALPLLALQYATASHQSAFGLLKNAVFATPFVMWLTIFGLQPHKEERFMYPAYPFLALNAAITLHVILSWLGNANPRTLIGMIPAKLKLLVVGLFVILAVDVGAWRTLGLIQAYRAPLQVYSSLGKEAHVGPETNVCIGKEWYRFPSSFFLPNGAHAKFVKSEFRGLLPGEFSEAKTGFGFFPGTWLVPAGMNDENIEDPSKYMSIEHCDYLIDVSFSGSAPSALEPDYVKQTSTWKAIHCEPFLDASSTSLIPRMLWIPDHPLVPEKFKRRWGDYCLLKRNKSA